jgi:hypothetical protein
MGARAFRGDALDVMPETRLRVIRHLAARAIDPIARRGAEIARRLIDGLEFGSQAAHLVLDHI